MENNLNILLKNKNNSISYQENSVKAFNFVIDEPNIEYFIGEQDKVYCVKNEQDEANLPNSLKKEIIFVIGILSMAEVLSVYKAKNPESIVIVIEPNLGIFKDALSRKNMNFFKNEDIYIFANEDLVNLGPFLSKIAMDYSFLAKVKNTKFYLTNYYREYELSTAAKIIKIIKHKLLSVIENLGNSIEDGMDGLDNHIRNLPNIFQSKDISKIEGAFENIPAFIVSAGPSLNNNIEELKKIDNKGVIIAVDTIANRLINEGIIPDFITTVERLEIVYEYFYKDKFIPKQVTLVGPSVLDPRIFKGYEGEFIIPIRKETGEGVWLAGKLGVSKNSGMLMGLSCAHVAFGLAEKLKCSPIVLVGQDLAYGENNNSYASGTEYEKLQDNKPTNLNEYDTIEGYYGNNVSTSRVWIQFKEWFEDTIIKYNLNVINATEGGANIRFTKKETLKHTINEFCKEQVNVYKTIKNTSNYDINIEKVIMNLEKEIGGFIRFRDDCLLYLNDLRSYEAEIKQLIDTSQLLKMKNKLKTIDKIIPQLMNHPLMSHNLQTVIIQYNWIINDQEQILSKENIDVERKAQIHLLGPIIATVTMIIEKIEKILFELRNDPTC